METTLFNAVFADAATRAILVERGLVPADASRYDLHETTMGTQLYQLYDGTLKVHGTKKLLWHRRPIDERKIQVLGEAERLFPFAPGGTSTEKKPRRPKRRKRRRSPETKPRAAPYAAYALAALFVASLVVHRRRRVRFARVAERQSAICVVCVCVSQSAVEERAVIRCAGFETRVRVS